MSARGATIFLTWLFERLTMSDGLRVARISIQLVDEPRAPRVRVFQDDEVLAGRALEGRARRGER